MAAATASMTSSVLTAAVTGAGAACETGVPRVTAGAAAALRNDAGACAGADGAELKAGAGAAAGAVPAIGPAESPLGGTAGSLMVGAVEGLGGKLIRTVSFLGWTFPVSFLGGNAPLGIFGMFSGIKIKFAQN